MHEAIAKIESTHLGYEDHGIFTLLLNVNYGGSGQSIGFHSLDNPSPTGKGRVGTRYGMEYIMRVMSACGVSKWEDVKGRTIIVLKRDNSWHSEILGLKPLPTENGKSFLFSDLEGIIHGD